MTAVLLALWHSAEAGHKALSIEQLLRDARVALPEAQKALDIWKSADAGCGVRPRGCGLLETSISCWCDILEDRARRMNRAIGRRTLVYARTTSTNDIAWQHAGSAEGDGLVVLADEQTAGRGRLGRTWSAATGQSVLLSVVLQNIAADAMNRLTLLAGLAVCVALEKVFERAGVPMRPVEIKWPNDLLIDGRKIAGVLVERRPSGRGAVVVGIGVNVHQSREDFPPDLREHATSLAVAGGAPDRLAVAALLLDALAIYCESEHLKQAGWIDEWKRRCTLAGRLVSVRCGSMTVTGHVVDVSPLHGLIVKDGSGAQHFLPAETSSLL